MWTEEIKGPGTLWREASDALGRHTVHWQEKNAPGNGVLEQVETKAQEAWRGLWADSQPVPPWEWRKRPRRTNLIGLDIFSY
jgi:endonuclease YncB( thermonuclease family)